MHTTPTRVNHRARLASAGALSSFVVSVVNVFTFSSVLVWLGWIIFTVTVLLLVLMLWEFMWL